MFSNLVQVSHSCTKLIGESYYTGLFLTLEIYAGQSGMRVEDHSICFGDRFEPLVKKELLVISSLPRGPIHRYGCASS